MAEVTFVKDGLTVDGLCATDAPESAVIAAIEAAIDTGGVPAAGVEHRLEEAQIVYTVRPGPAAEPVVTIDRTDGVDATEASQAAAVLSQFGREGAAPDTTETPPQ